MKKILITGYNLDIGGIETSLINLLKSFDLNKYEITLVLEKKEGIFLSHVPENIKVIDYDLCYSKNIFYRKIKNYLTFLRWKKHNKNKYDFSICFATHSRLGALLALTGSKNNAMWIHGNYCKCFDYDMKKLTNFFRGIKLDKFNNYVFVSHENKNETIKYYKLEGNLYVINNIIEGDKIIKKSKEKIEYEKPKKTLFVNVSRHDEVQKKISRLIEASRRLAEDGYQFELLLVGDGKDNNFYKELVDKYKLNEVVKFVGKKANPFPYYKLADAIVLSSQSEGYPVVFNEARVMNIPLITTKVSDYNDIKDKFGIVTEQEEIYIGMKQFLEQGFAIEEKFDYTKYNQNILKEIDSIINNINVK